MSAVPVDLGKWFLQHAGDTSSLKADQVPRLVDHILSGARSCGASDIHLRPTGDGLEMRWRIDGVIQTVTSFPQLFAANIIARLKVLANLLTYRVDVPQEGRLQSSVAGEETRISVFPTQFGEKVVIRLFADSGRLELINDLDLPEDIVGKFNHLLEQTSGVIVLTGPAGSGKTTTIYAAMREMLHKSAGERSLVSLEDPVEVVVPHVDQTSANPKAGMDMMTGLRSLVRQDPDVIMVGEIRDRETAETVFQASLIGNLILTTFHAGSCTRALSRLSDMGIEPYLLRSGLLAVFSQRLLRALCRCKKISTDESDLLDGEFESVALPVGCDVCRGTGYLGRKVLSEYLDPDWPEISEAILKRQDVKTLNELAAESGMISLRDRARKLVAEHIVSPQEMIRVLGAS
ncbi:GspE/PulE family protein [Rubinisphaera sp.]|uniref:GspE/PulE family protein n=1 Tax=Rubinisphaera sp. TaxID=2024857 RepID=UPI000C0D8B24|nr:GspE/PulE family protein [Rubinisphaera sp.]MBV11421.1 secretion protein [Rubinisphaera sp.]HCS51677.1 secretion protein [Planctomycetaceae bacterium]|tara:strand:+ start:1558 stop:2769 length:1212 start_codon:yes stop_codon:yes gene_type:complete